MSKIWSLLNASTVSSFGFKKKLKPKIKKIIASFFYVHDSQTVLHGTNADLKPWLKKKKQQQK